VRYFGCIKSNLSKRALATACQLKSDVSKKIDTSTCACQLTQNGVAGCRIKLQAFKLTSCRGGSAGQGLLNRSICMRPKVCQYLSLLADTMGLLGAGWHSRGSILLVLQQPTGAQCNHLLQLHAEPLVPGHHHRHCRQWPKLEHHSEFFLPPGFVILHPLMRNAIIHMRCISCLCVQRLSPCPLLTAQQPGL